MAFDFFFVSLAHSRRRRGGGRPPPFGSKRRKSSKIRANSLFIWANSLDIWAHHCQKTVSVSVKTFFFCFGEHLKLDRKTVQISGKTFFFLENTLIWAEKTVSILTEKRNASSHFSGKSLLPPQIILSSYGQWRIQKILVGGDFKHKTAKIWMSSPKLRVVFWPDSLRLGWWGGCTPKWSRIIRNRG